MSFVEGKKHFNAFLEFRSTRPTCDSLTIPSYYLTGDTTQEMSYFSTMIGNVQNFRYIYVSALDLSRLKKIQWINGRVFFEKQLFQELMHTFLPTSW